MKAEWPRQACAGSVHDSPLGTGKLNGINRAIVMRVEVDLVTRGMFRWKRQVASFSKATHRDYLLDGVSPLSC